MRPSVIVVMGVAGAGKSTVGRHLAHTLGWSFADGDAYHTPEAWAKLERADPLTDADRAPWLARLQGVIADHWGTNTPLVIACSALRAEYRRVLVPPALPPGALRYVFLRVPPAVAEQRLRARRGHGVGAALVPSQFATLEEPADAVWVDATMSVEDVTLAILQALELEPAGR